MKITNIAIQALKGNKRLRTRLALELDRHTASIDRWINLNEPNGELTTAKALQIIREETCLSDSDILEEDKVIA